jgi:hypothetical protein
MRSEFIGMWSDTRREIWPPLIDQPLGEDEEGLLEDIFCSLAWSPRPSVEDLASITDSPVQRREQ